MPGTWLDDQLGAGNRPANSAAKVTAGDPVDEAATWGIRPRAASAVVTETLNQVLAAIPATPGDARVLAVIRDQAERVSLG